MKRKILCTTLTLLMAAMASNGLAKDDKKKDKDKDKGKEGVVYIERDGTRYYVDRDGKRHKIDGGDRVQDRDRGRDDHDHDRDRDRYRDSRDSRDDHHDHGDSHRDRSRTIYVIERNRPVERQVFIDPSGRYYRVVDGRRTYVQERYYESYPSKYYYPDGRRRVTITLPF